MFGRNSTLTRLLAPAVAMYALHAAFAGNVGITCTTPTNTSLGVAVVEITIGGTTYPINVFLEPGLDAETKAQRIADAVDNHKVPNFSVDHPAVGSAEFTIKNLPDGAIVEFHSYTTGEAADKVEIGKIDFGFSSYQGHFDPFAANGQPAIFTAGIVTDVGELATQVSASELNFQTDGPIICQALFQRLAPHAPQYGAQINYAGDRLEIYFDPAYTVTQGGIIFGTNSLSPGASGGVMVPHDPDAPDCNNNGVLDGWDIDSGASLDLNLNGIPDECEGGACEPCDTNCDGSVNGFDIGPFADLLAGVGTPCSPCAGDTNADGSVNGFDISGFIDCLNAP